MSKPENADEARAVIAASKRLAREGVDPSTPEHFAQLTRRMASAFPDLKVKSLDGKAVATGQRQRGGNGQVSPVSSGKATGSGGGQSASKTVVKLSGADFAQMKAMNLDPANKDHLKSWAKAKANVRPENFVNSGLVGQR